MLGLAVCYSWRRDQAGTAAGFLSWYLIGFLLYIYYTDGFWHFTADMHAPCGVAKFSHCYMMS